MLHVHDYSKEAFACLYFHIYTQESEIRYIPHRRITSTVNVITEYFSAIELEKSASTVHCEAMEDLLREEQYRQTLHCRKNRC